LNNSQIDLFTFDFFTVLAKQPKKNVPVPYHESKLTQLLQESLRGNHKTLMLACICPSIANRDNSLSCLRYAHRTRQIKNHVTPNLSIKDESDTIVSTHIESPLKEMEAEMTELKQKLSQISNEFDNYKKRGNDGVNDLSVLKTELNEMRNLHIEDGNKSEHHTNCSSECLYSESKSKKSKNNSRRKNKEHRSSRKEKLPYMSEETLSFGSIPSTIFTKSDLSYANEMDSYNSVQKHRHTRNSSEYFKDSESKSGRSHSSKRMIKPSPCAGLRTFNQLASQLFAKESSQINRMLPGNRKGMEEDIRLFHQERF